MSPGELAIEAFARSRRKPFLGPQRIFSCKWHGHLLELGAYDALLHYTVRRLTCSISFDLHEEGRVPPRSVPLADSPNVSARTLEHVPGVQRWLRAPGIPLLISSLALRGEERVGVYTNGLGAELSTDRPIPETLLLFERLIASLPKTEGKQASTDVRQIPRELKGLRRLAATWGIADDVARADRLARITARQRAQLLALVPLLPTIRSYLDTVEPAALSEQDLQLDDLAQAVAELLAEEHGTA